MSKVTKAVIPAAGLGTRFLPATKAQPKEMIPVVDKPAIQYVVEEAVRSGIDDILIITGRNKHSLEDHFDRRLELEHELETKGKHDLLSDIRDLADLADIHYVRQGEPLGLGHAVSVARKHVGDHPFAVMLGDDIMDGRSTVLSEMIHTFEATGSSVIACKEFPPELISHYGCVSFEPAGDRLLKVLGLVEKPKPEDAPSSWAVLGRYVFTPGIFDALDRIEPGAGGELQLTDGIALLLETEEVLGYTFVDGRYDVGNKQDYLRATVELALAREDLGPEFRTWLAQYVRDQGIV
jgi:UTP--glucose-1-phosphate uridylyltransferase